MNVLKHIVKSKGEMVNSELLFQILITTKGRKVQNIIQLMIVV